MSLGLSKPPSTLAAGQPARTRVESWGGDNGQESHGSRWVMDKTLQEPTDSHLGPHAPQMESHEQFLLFMALCRKEKV